jgi:hypothetical protein
VIEPAFAERGRAESGSIDQLRGALRDVRRTRCGITQLIQRLGETIKIMNGFRLRADAECGRSCVPMRGHREYRARTRQFSAKVTPELRGGTFSQCHHRRTVRKK